MRDLSYNIFSLQATALVVGREICLIGTANIGPMPGYTTLESLPGTETKKPLTIGYYQNVHFNSLEENKKYDLFSCPECKEDFGTESLLEKHKKKYHVYVDILVDFADIQFEVSDRKRQNLEDLDNEESEHEYDPTEESDSEEECVWPSNNSEREKLLIDQECIQCSTCDSTFCWQSGLRAHIKSMHTGKFKCDQCHWSFRSTEKLEEHIGYLHEKNIDRSNTEEELDRDENDETEDLNKEKLDQLPVKQKPKCHKCGWSFITNDTC